MCGIFLKINRGSERLDVSQCNRALSTLSRRGPDLTVSKIIDKNIFIGHTILSLTGESIAEQSLTYCTSRSKRFRVALNGEIYNYRELAKKWLMNHVVLTPKTTDTEILVNLCEVIPIDKIPEILDGMYAYILIDEVDQSIYLSRDLQGEKSLYIYEDEKTIIASSEIQAIKQVTSLELNRTVFSEYFRTRHFMQPTKTAYKRVRQLQPGATEQIKFNAFGIKLIKLLSKNSLIDASRIENNISRSNDDLADELDEILIKNTKEMIPNGHKYASIISGGVDSSLLTHYITNYGNPDCLIAVNNVGKDSIANDLSGFEKIYNRPIDIININPFEYAAEISNCQKVCGSPLLSHSFTSQSIMSRYLHSMGYKVMYGGEGADEYFGGYNTYLQPNLKKVRYSQSAYMNYMEDLDYLQNDSESSLGDELSAAWRSSLEAYAPYFKGDELIRLAMMYADSAYQLPSVGLRGADLMSMMWGMETRSIFLRKDVISFALNLPISAKIDLKQQDSVMQTKVLLKKLFLRYYPLELLSEKQGFTGFPGESAKFLGELEDYLTFESIGIGKPKNKLLTSSPILWKLTNIEYFLRNGQYT
jgi:asparagine synthase (glutamine-hydrolysing)